MDNAAKMSSTPKVEDNSSEEKKLSGKVDLLSMSQIENAFFSKLRAEIEDRISESLDYSISEEQIRPETYESSPEVETRYKHRSPGLSSLLKNMTIRDKQWDDDISDDSFVRVENYIKESENEENDTLESAKESDADSYFDEKDDPKPPTPVNDVSKDSLQCQPRSESLIDDLKSKNNDIIRDSLDCDPQLELSKTETNSLYFNDTLEEMEHFINHGFKSMQNKHSDDPIPIKPERVKNSIPKIHVTPTIPSPIMAKIKPMERKPNTPSCSVTPFKIPAKTAPLKHPNTKSPALKPKTILSHRLDKYDNVISPVGFYIRNSPTVPMMKNVSPAKNYWDRTMPKNIHSPMSKLRIDKENKQLPEKAYKSPKITNIVEKPELKHLPKNNGVFTMTQNLPNIVVIKHIKREKLDRAKKSILKASNADDSFAHLPIKSMDVSHCVGHQAARTGRKQL